MDIDEYRKLQSSMGGRRLPPGYRGHVPGVRTHTMGKTFGAAIDAAVRATFLVTKAPVDYIPHGFHGRRSFGVTSATETTRCVPVIISNTPLTNIPPLCQ
jgi:hypothetical protein